MNLTENLVEYRAFLSEKIKAVDYLIDCYEADKKGVLPTQYYTDEADTKKSRRTYPFKQMKVGDSFEFGEYSAIEMNKARNAVNSWAKYPKNSKYKFSVEKTDDNRIVINRI